MRELGSRIRWHILGVLPSCCRCSSMGLQSRSMIGRWRRVGIGSHLGEERTVSSITWYYG